MAELATRCMFLCSPRLVVRLYVILLSLSNTTRLQVEDAALASDGAGLMNLSPHA